MGVCTSNLSGLISDHLITSCHRRVESSIAFKTGFNNEISMMAEIYSKYVCSIDKCTQLTYPSIFLFNKTKKYGFYVKQPLTKANIDSYTFSTFTVFFSLFS